MYVRAQLAPRSGNIRPLQHWSRSQMSRSWRQGEKQPQTVKLDAHIDTYRVSRLRAGVPAVTIGIDVQAESYPI
jgi:hypothetical protein